MDDFVGERLGDFNVYFLFGILHSDQTAEEDTASQGKFTVLLIYFVRTHR